MRLNARQVFYEDNSHTTILLAIEDITEERARDRGLKDLLQQKDILLQEMQHRVANSLQIIAGILMLKARTVRSEETRQHLAGAHQRVMAVAAVQEQLRSGEASTAIALAPYLSRLCVTLTAAMIIEQHPIRLVVNAQDGTASSSEAVNIGLLVTELVINAIKHAFPEQLKDPTVTVAYARAGASWRLSVSDNGIGRPEGSPEMTPGLGTTIVGALAKQLDAHVEVAMDPRGTRVTVTHVSFDSPALAAAP
jgi:chemotaxis protein methyltransferase CheR